MQWSIAFPNLDPHQSAISLCTPRVQNNDDIPYTKRDGDENRSRNIKKNRGCGIPKIMPGDGTTVRKWTFLVVTFYADRSSQNGTRSMSAIEITSNRSTAKDADITLERRFQPRVHIQKLKQHHNQQFQDSQSPIVAVLPLSTVTVFASDVLKRWDSNSKMRLSWSWNQQQS